MYCDDRAGLVEERIDRILTQYRESPNLLGIIRHDLGQIADIIIAANGSRGLVADVLSDDSNVLFDTQQIVAPDPDCPSSPGIPEKFNIYTAVGDQLTIIGKWLGFPRCHCICQGVPLFGFSCGVTSGTVDIVGLCEGGVWFGCGDGGTADICLDDDETYRVYLLARRYQARQLWDIDSLQAAANHLWGATATVVSMGGARVAIMPGRPLTSLEMIQLPVAFRVLPIAPGITPYISYNSGVIFGFGSGWGGFCDSSQWFCPQEFDAYDCN